MIQRGKAVKALQFVLIPSARLPGNPNRNLNSISMLAASVVNFMTDNNSQCDVRAPKFPRYTGIVVQIFPLVLDKEIQSKTPKSGLRHFTLESVLVCAAIWKILKLIQLKEYTFCYMLLFISGKSDVRKLSWDFLKQSYVDWLKGTCLFQPREAQLIRNEELCLVTASLSDVWLCSIKNQFRGNVYIVFFKCESGLRTLWYRCSEMIAVSALKRVGTSI